MNKYYTISILVFNMGICKTLNFTKMFSYILNHYSKLWHKKLLHAQKILTLLLREMVVNPMFPKCSILID